MTLSVPLSVKERKKHQNYNPVITLWEQSIFKSEYFTYEFYFNCTSKEVKEQNTFTCFMSYEPSSKSTIHYTAQSKMSSWLVALFFLSAPCQSPSSSPPPPPSSRPRPTSHVFPSSRFSSELVSHYLSEIKTTVPRIPQNLRGLRRGVRQEVVMLCISNLLFIFFIMKLLLLGVCVSRKTVK